MGDIVNMQGTEVLAFVGYQDFEAAADRTATKIKEGYMEMGYILKMAKETDILVGSQYADYEDFAYRRYGLDKSKVSRYIRIVNRFSVGGNSHILKESYKNMGFTKLSEMLFLPDAIAEELMDSLSKTEVQAIREEIEAENAISDIEVAIEAAEQPEPELSEDSLLAKAVWELGKEQPQLYKKLFAACAAEADKRFKEILAPQGDAVYTPRIPGMGRLMLAISDARISVTVVRTQEKETFNEEQLTDAVYMICKQTGEDAETAYKMTYDMPFPEPETPAPEKPSVAPVQPERRKESKVTKAATPKKPKPTPKPEDTEEPEEDIQIPGQMNVGDYEGVVPEATYEEIKEEIKEEDENGGNTGNNQDVTGLPDGVGAAGDALQPGADAGASGEPETDAACDPDEGAGITEGGGCETDHGTVEDVWMEIYKNHSDLTKYLTVWEAQRELMEPEMIGKLYQMSVAMAAGFERLMRRAGNE